MTEIFHVPTEELHIQGSSLIPEEKETVPIIK
jgi:hypothetical protein